MWGQFCILAPLPLCYRSWNQLVLLTHQNIALYNQNCIGGRTFMIPWGANVAKFRFLTATPHKKNCSTVIAVKSYDVMPNLSN
jgi:hypothetical protein